MATGFYLLDNPQHPKYPQCAKKRRNGAKASGTIILHDAEGGTDVTGADTGAENVANYIRTRASFGSYHDLVDRDTHIPMAPIDFETWHSVPDNNWSIGICVAWNKADLPRMSYAIRRAYYVALARVVLKRVAEFARRGITVPIDRMLSAAETQDRKPGISTHSRTDPDRRSDPFGTGSVYEREFLAVLAELAGAPTTPTPTGGFMAQLTDDEQQDLKEKVDAIFGVLTRKIKDGKGATTPDEIWERTLAGIRSVRADQLADDAVPVEVDVDADDVADALLARLSPSIARDVADALATRLAQ